MPEENLTIEHNPDKRWVRAICSRCGWYTSWHTNEERARRVFLKNHTFCEGVD